MNSHQKIFGCIFFIYNFFPIKKREGKIFKPIEYRGYSIYEIGITKGNNRVKTKFIFFCLFWAILPYTI